MAETGFVSLFFVQASLISTVFSVSNCSLLLRCFAFFSSYFSVLKHGFLAYVRACNISCAFMHKPTYTLVICTASTHTARCLLCVRLPRSGFPWSTCKTNKPTLTYPFNTVTKNKKTTTRKNLSLRLFAIYIAEIQKETLHFSCENIMMSLLITVRVKVACDSARKISVLFTIACLFITDRASEHQCLFSSLVAVV